MTPRQCFLNRDCSDPQWVVLPDAVRCAFLLFYRQKGAAFLAIAFLSAKSENQPPTRQQLHNGVYNIEYYRVCIYDKSENNTRPKR